MSFSKWVVLPALLLFLISCAHSTPSVTESVGSDSKAPQTTQKNRAVKDGSSQKPVQLTRLNNAPAPADRASAATGEDCPPEVTAKKVLNEPGDRIGVSPSAPGATLENQGYEPDVAIDEPEDEMDESLVLLKQAEEYRQKGDIDRALKTLDQAYALILDVNGESNLARQKDDLRLMISMRIVQIYTSKSGLTNGKRGEIPIVMNDDVEKEIRSFQTIERSFFIRSYQRSGFYLPIVKRYLKDAGLPQELAWLPLVESGFQAHALSRARALGLWQFIPSTGYKYGLTRDLWVDERMSVEKSTRAAIAYLKDLHSIFGDWLTVLAAYNCGEGRVLKVISTQQINYLDRFWDLYHLLPYETARYVPRFLATLHIIKDPKRYGMDLEGDMACPIEYELVKTQKSMRLQEIARNLSIPTETLILLNSELRHQQTPDKEYSLKVPVGLGKQLAMAEPQIEEAKPPVYERTKARKGRKYVKHRVRSGETVQSIAGQYGVSSKTLLAYNGMSSSQTKLKSGRVIRVPLATRSKSKKTKAAKKDRGKKQTPSGGPDVISYKVRQGDTLFALASRYNTSASEIKKLNHLKSDQLKKGQVIRIKTAKTDAGG
ncbi:MAG TPA: LysM peptidoglycan-binding domain-containing protein [Syntrophales bacterium]|nr:LysM peptidoglycan-binding domain-containing protein [Syntrophales bacterium]HOX95287.1 LysM peptidoglycan-binding domain-containing protein [Syntrophales bacterium]HPI55937.1 LysM peptidoglycan-binding domain-containing protein [Syntrophales bacterium]HPN23572.1 LysM peptidoglycan-binding domain-containing protein [Syntrophales bacterium]HQM27903.1 LysM peptidoglycan-binding domain-containing protein [Syntrophales bacterium]